MAYSCRLQPVAVAVMAVEAEALAAVAVAVAPGDATPPAIELAVESAEVGLGVASEVALAASATVLVQQASSKCAAVVVAAAVMAVEADAAAVIVVAVVATLQSPQHVAVKSPQFESLEWTVAGPAARQQFGPAVELLLAAMREAAEPASAVAVGSILRLPDCQTQRQPADSVGTTLGE